ncbi:MAG: hypothetical protein HYZ01_07745 [Ignavibacteriales bacterium]|nr:hypothetical protein [Ignavibacteriales bacterium]
MKHSLFIFLALVVLTPSRTCADDNGRGAKAIALGNAFVAMADNAWSLRYNPAGLAHLSVFHGSAFYVPEQFGLPELRTVAAAAVMPLGFGGVGLAMDQFGFDLYRETHFAAGAGAKLDWGVSGGLAVNLHSFFIERYGSTQRVTLDLGLLAEAAPGFVLGFGLKNVTGTMIGPFQERLPQIFSLGSLFTPVPDCSLSLELEKDTRHPFMVKAGVEQWLFDVLALRVGVSDNPNKVSAGFAARSSGVEFAYAGYSHNQLGWTHQLEISIWFEVE